ncbi:ComEC/Rec2 family competence protein [Parasphingopyxis algicola]|uniref:ComEC/Rec2 family competence protein n=1 Tax=Parasphingopyxis algicola TaxID=2026624 RepID=UPI001FE7A2DF|nr:ComEC/Rec2 family competence protein [Parasphingopyxis algicola]
MGARTSIAPGGRQSRLSGFFSAIENRLERERDQLPLWLPVALGFGIASWFALTDRNSWIAFLLTGAGLGLAALTLARTMRLARGIGIFALVAGIGCVLIWVRAEWVDTETLERPVVSRFAAEIVSVEHMPARESVRLMLRSPTDPALPRQFRVNIDEDVAPGGLRAGAWISLRARLMPPPRAAVPGGYDFSQRAWFSGIGATGRAWGDIEIVRPASGDSWRGWLETRRARLAAHVAERVGGGEGAIAATLATGDRGRIAEEDAEAMRRSGLAHLLAISGLHVTAVIGVAMLLVLKLLALSPRLALNAPLILIAAGAGALAGLSYTLFTGAQVPTVRACVAAMLVLVGVAMGRDAITLRLVAAGALVILLFWPETLVGPSFQLSFAAVTAIIALHEHPRAKKLLSRRDEPWTAKIGRFTLGLLLTGLVVEIALMPIALFHFNKAGLYGALANIVAIPLTTFIIIPLEALALFLDIFGLGAPVWWLVGQTLGLLLDLAHGVSGTPGAVALLPAMPIAAYALMIVGGLWFCLWKTEWRFWGFAPIAAGAIWALVTPAADVLVTGDGRHMAVRESDGRLALLRPRAGDYVRDMFNETSGTEAEAGALEDLPAAWCSADSCRTTIWRGDRQWRVFATRSRYYLPYPALVEECAAADIVVSDRRMPEGCTPRWLLADRTLLRETGGLAITLSPPGIRTVLEPGDDHPWRRVAQ